MAEQALELQQNQQENRQQLTKDISKPKVKDLEDKSLDELVLTELYYDIARNLPPDDVLIFMHQDDLMTDGQKGHYKMMKANNHPEVERSEYLLDCLRKGEPGFLDKLCDILRKIPPASYIADNIQDKRVQLMSQQPTTKTPARTDRTKRLHVKGDAHWMAEYKKLERRTRLQLQAKEREITRLRRVIQQCETEHSANLQRLLSEMRCQVENLSKWIENKGETFPLSSSLVNMALSHRDDIDIFSGTGESSSNQSSLERPPKRLHKRKMPLEGHSPRSTGPSAMNSTVAASTDHPGDVSGPPILQHFSANISNPPSAVESDTLDISRVPVQVTDFTADLSRQPDLGNNEEYPTRLVLQNDSNTKCDQPVPVSTTTVFNTSVNPPISAGKFPTGAAPSCSLWKSRETAALPTIDESHTPSTVKSNTTSPTLSPQGDINTPKSSKGFKFAKDIISPKSYKVDQESTADFRAVFRKIRGKDPPTK